MKRFFLFAAALAYTGALLSANAGGVFAQEPGTTPAATKPAEITPEKKKSIEELLELTGVVKLMRASIADEINAAEASDKSVSKATWDKMRSRFDEKVPVLVERMIPVYDKNFTQEEINSFIAFYKTPAGKKLAEKLPVTEREGGAVASQWAREISMQVSAEMATEANKGKSAPTKAFDTKPFKGNGKPVTTASGLKYEDMTVGTGATAVNGKTAIVHYTGTLQDGTKFDSSRDRGQAFDFPLGAGRVIKGWDEGVAGMKVGGRRRLVIPASLGYGEVGTPGGPIPPNATLIFDVELMGVQ